MDATRGCRREDVKEDARVRVVITGVSPEIDHGRFAIKRTVGEQVVVEADIFADGHDMLRAVLLDRHEHDPRWSEVPLTPVGNDRWRGAFTVTQLGQYCYTLQAWVDPFLSWRQGFVKKVEAGQEVAVELLIGAQLVAEAGQRAAGEDAKQLHAWAQRLRHDHLAPLSERIALALADELAHLVGVYADRRFAAMYERELRVRVDREKARFSAWYEMFPRSAAAEPGRHGTFKDCETRLPYVASMGFDVLYFPPIHPIGRTCRKGKNNALVAAPTDPGSPWAIGAAEGGHTAVHPQLGTLEDFRRLVARAKEYGLEIALDLAFQCTPDHPYVKEHPEWFRRRPDGTVQYAENPPKKYEDIYPFDFDTAHWRELWAELKRIVCFWIEQGVRIFRVDNPHTKPFRFWEWLIAEVTARYPEVIFLSEAFTRPKVRYHLAKLGFSQSYTYFAWRNTKAELTQYFTELTQTEVREYFRPHLWPNTPDILTEYLQLGGRPAFMTRLILAATLGANYGIYGPAFELCENRPREAGSEEYLDSEKYEIRHWQIERPESLKDLIARVNRIRRQNPALQSDWSLRFHHIDNEALICYSKSTADRTNVILVVVNLDPYHTQAGWTDLSLEVLGLEPHQSYQVHDLLSDARYLWQGARNYVELNPQAMPAHVLRVRHRVRTERDFDYYM
ncbi:MAG: alpha-1,4-glucan--maltose-1-phosphate maltosyltransferase [Candidatus Binatia bacterium]|nr:alpha-1,4-glucan--maltose-1-phosphate maltosyltransferase [Candidatus Binatia bacterium]